MPGLRPIVEGIDTTLLLNNSLTASELFTVSDPDGDPITEYIFSDSGDPSSGFFVFRGVVQGNGIELTVAAEDLDELVYVAGPIVNSETITIRASDGTLLSEPALVAIFTARPESIRPVVQIDSVTVLGNESISASAFISAFDPDGFPIQSYSIRDRSIDKSFFSLDGNAVQQGVFRIYSADEFARLHYNAVGRKTENIDVFAFDGTINSLFTTEQITTRPNLNRPVVNFASAITVQDELLPIADLINTSDADGNTIKYIELRDRNSKSFSGSLVFQGALLEAKQFHRFSLDEIDQVFFVGGERPITEQIRVRVGDGRFRSAINTIELDNVAGGGGGGPNVGRPVLIADNSDESVREQLDFVPINSLVQQTNEGFPATIYEVIDTNPDTNSSSLFLNGVRMSAGTVLTFTDDEYENQLDIRTGVFENRHFDEIYVRASNGSFNGRWTRLNMHTEPEFFEAFTGLDPNGNVFATWADFIPANGAAPRQITFSFMQQIPDYDTDEAEDFWNRMPTPRLFFEFTPQQRAAARQVFASIETFANLEFVEVVDSPLTVDPVSGNRGGTLRFGNYYRAADELIGGTPGADNSFDCASPNNNGYGFPGLAPEDGDLYYNVEIGQQIFMDGMPPVDAPSTCGLAGLDFLGFNVGPGTTEYEVLLGDIAFILGQAPPFDAIGPNDQNPILPAATSNNKFTVQAGFDFFDPNTFNFVNGYQLYDVNFFQQIYGANDLYNLGNDTYSIANLTQGANARQTIWDAGGEDTISGVGSSIDNVQIDLRPGFFSSIGNLNENISIAFRAEIENAIGSDGDDLLIGNELNNRIIGGAGADILRGNGGNDFLTGGAGGDRFVFTVADGDNRINEDRLAGRDTVEFLQFPGLDDFTEDFTFRLDGRDLVIQLTLENGPSDTTVTIEDQTRGAFRIETLVLGTTTVDLVNLTEQATGANQSFALTPEATIFGNLVTPV